MPVREPIVSLWSFEAAKAFGTNEARRLVFRQTPSGEPRVPEILLPGLKVNVYGRWRNGDPFIVHRALGPFVFSPYAGLSLEYWGLSLTREEWRNNEFSVENELVAVGGRVLGLFEGNPVQVVPLGMERVQIVVPSVQAAPKQGQLTLF